MFLGYLLDLRRPQTGVWSALGLRFARPRSKTPWPACARPRWKPRHAILPGTNRRSVRLGAREASREARPGKRKRPRGLAAQDAGQGIEDHLPGRPWTVQEGDDLTRGGLPDGRDCLLLVKAAEHPRFLLAAEEGDRLRTVDRDHREGGSPDGVVEHDPESMDHTSSSARAHAMPVCCHRVAAASVGRVHHIRAPFWRGILSTIYHDARGRAWHGPKYAKFIAPPAASEVGSWVAAPSPCTGDLRAGYAGSLMYIFLPLGAVGPSLVLERVVPPVHERVLVKLMIPPSRLRSSFSVSSPSSSTSKRAP
jgi:hypothetical protein